MVDIWSGSVKDIGCSAMSLLIMGKDAVEYSGSGTGIGRLFLPLILIIFI